MRLLLSLFLTFLPLYAIIDIASIDFGDKKEGLSGSVYGSFETKRGNTDKEEAEYGGRLEFDTNKTITWIQGSAEHDTASGYTTDDNAFIHLRHIHQIGDPSWAAEAYFQLKQNEFKNLNNRTLLGAGLRYKVFDSYDYGKLFFGMSAMDEKITYNEVDPNEHNSRLSTYLSYKVNINKTFELSYLGYYQMKFEDNSDYLASSMAEMTIHLTKVFDLSYLIEFDYDAAPALNIRNTDTRQKLSFIYRFGENDPLSTYAQTVLYQGEVPADVMDESDADEVKQVKEKTFEGKWLSEGESLTTLSGSMGVHMKEGDIYKEKFTWKRVSTAQGEPTKQIIFEFMDEEGRKLRTEYYLWSEDTLVGLMGNRVKVFKR